MHTFNFIGGDRDPLWDPAQWPLSTPALTSILAEVPSSHLPASSSSSFLERFVVPIEIAEGLLL